MAVPFDRFTDRARHVLQLAQEEARRFNHNYFGTEHLLLGLIREQEGVGARVLAELGLELYRVRSATEFIVGRGDRNVAGAIDLTPRAKKSLALAVDTADQLQHATVTASQVRARSTNTAPPEGEHHAGYQRWSRQCWTAIGGGLGAGVQQPVDLDAKRTDV